MSSAYDSKEELYLRMEDLQQKLRESEGERSKLEKRCNVLMRAFREEEKNHYKTLNNKYEKFLEDCKLRRRRNDTILRSLYTVEDKARALYAKTERLKLLKDRYITYVKHNNRQDEDETSMPWRVFSKHSPLQKTTTSENSVSKSVHWKTPYVEDYLLDYDTEDITKDRNFSEAGEDADLGYESRQENLISGPDVVGDKLYKYLTENQDYPSVPTDGTPKLGGQNWRIGNKTELQPSFNDRKQSREDYSVSSSVTQSRPSLKATSLAIAYASNARRNIISRQNDTNEGGAKNVINVPKEDKNLGFRSVSKNEKLVNSDSVLTADFVDQQNLKESNLPNSYTSSPRNVISNQTEKYEVSPRNVGNIVLPSENLNAGYQARNKANSGSNAAQAFINVEKTKLDGPLLKEDNLGNAYVSNQLNTSLKKYDTSEQSPRNLCDSDRSRENDNLGYLTNNKEKLGNNDLVVTSEFSDINKASALRQRGVLKHQQSIDQLKLALSMEDPVGKDNSEGGRPVTTFKSQYDEEELSDKNVVEKDEVEISEKDEQSFKYDASSFSGKRIDKHNGPNLITPNSIINHNVKYLVNEEIKVKSNEMGQETQKDNFNEKENCSAGELPKNDEILPKGLDGVDYQNETYPESYYEQPVRHHDYSNIVSNVILEEDEYDIEPDQPEDVQNVIVNTAHQPQLQLQMFGEDNSQSSYSSSQRGQSPAEKKSDAICNDPLNKTNKQLRGSTEKFRPDEGHFDDGNSQMICEEIKNRDLDSDRSLDDPRSGSDHHKSISERGGGDQGYPLKNESIRNLTNVTQSNLAHLLDSDSESFQIEHCDRVSANEDSDFDFSFHQT